MSVNKRGFKAFQAKDGSAEELYRVQQSVSEAIRRLADDVDIVISENPGPTGPTGATGADGADGVWVGPAVGVIPTGFTVMYTWSGRNKDNALRHLVMGNTPDSSTVTTCLNAETRFMVPFAGTFQTMILTMDAPYPNGGQTGNPSRFTVRKNGVGNSATYDTALEIALNVASVGGTRFTNLVNSVHFAAGDFVGVTYNEVAMGGAMTAQVYVNILFVAD